MNKSRPEGASRVVVTAGSPAETLEFLCQRFPRVGRTTWLNRLQRGRVLDEQWQSLAPGSLCYPGQVLYYFRELEHEVEVPFQEVVLFENERLLVADKPHFLATAPVGSYVEQTLLRRLQRRFGLPQLTPIHRLDRLTAGVLVLCKKPQHRDAYQALFRQQRVVKIYEALAAPLPHLGFPLERNSCIVNDDQYFFRSREVDRPANSRTRIEVLEQQEHYWRYRLLPLTGRKHQLRLHMCALGAPIFGDDFYPQPQRRAAADFTRPLQLLARSLAFTDPLSGEQLFFASQRTLQLA